MSPLVIIIGAGIAGLAAAKHLKQNGIECFILEAQDRIGGRIKTLSSEDCLLDHGASWVHGVFGNPLSEIISSENIETIKARESKHFLYGKKGIPINDDGETKKIINSFEKDFVEKIKENHSLAQAFEEHISDLSYQDDLLSWYKHEYMAATGAALDEIDARAYFTDEYQKGGDDLVVGGYRQILNPFLDGLDIRLDEAVSTIECGQDVKIKTLADKKYICDAVILTVPLGVLKKKKIEFFPPLPTDKTNAIQRLEMGVLNKTFCFFESSFWSEDVEGFGVAGPDYQNFPYVLNLKPIAEKNLLCFFSYGNQAVEMEKLSDEEVGDRVISYLSHSFENLPKLEKIIRTNWGDDPWTYGSYSFVATGNSETDYDIMAESYLDKIFFAGEATSLSYRATVNGAMDSGVREADKIINIYH
ncbi:MAG: hypothetical protein COA79_12465 [Planctomycetota bacterium]|nr:MAG: hypothetical protein COA79_12465 [Planctomycetota bacterium]